MKLAFCEQCERAMWSQRSTKRFCSNACQQKHKRGVEPVPYWKLFEEGQDKQLQDTLALIALESPKTFADLQRLKGKYGHNAMLAAVNIVISLGGVK